MQKRVVVAIISAVIIIITTTTLPLAALPLTSHRKVKLIVVSDVQLSDS